MVINWITFSTLIGIIAILYLLNRFVLNPVGQWWQHKGLNRVIDEYEKTLIWALNHRLRTVGIAVLILISSFVVFGAFNPGTEFFPENIPPRDVYVQVETPLGSDVEFTRSIIDEVVADIPFLPQYNDVNSVLATSGAVISNDPGAAGGGNPTHRGTVALNFIDFQEKGR